MIMCAKLQGLACVLLDGSKSEKDLTPGQVERRIKDVPTLLEFGGFVFFGPACVTGPFLEFSDYINFVQFKGHYAKLPRGLTDGYVTVRPALLSLAQAIFWVVIFIGGSNAITQ